MTRHLALVLRRLAEVMSSRFFEFSGQSEEAIMCTHAEHRAILKALQARDGELAAKRSAAHFSARGGQAVEHLHSVGFWRDAD